VEITVATNVSTAQLSKKWKSQPHLLKPHALTSTSTHMFSPAQTRTKRKPYAKRRSGLTKQRPDDVTHKPPMGRQLWKRLCAERVNAFQTVLSNTHTHTHRYHTHAKTHTQVLGPPYQEGDSAMDTQH